jgi:hypothetical protein
MGVGRSRLLNTCNITDATPRKQIRDFSAGVNDLGLWNSMVCWPLAVFAELWEWTTAFSLGGLGTFNGTLVNGPTWGATSGASMAIKNARRMSLFATNSAFGQPTQADRFAGFVASQHPFFAVFGAGLTSGNSSTLYTLYKSTLGTGLGLP